MHPSENQIQGFVFVARIPYLSVLIYPLSYQIRHENSLLTLFTLTALLLAGCKKDDPGGVDIPVTDVTINHDYILLNLADSEGGLTLQGSVLPADASDPTLIWSSENPDIAAVDPSTGAVTAKSAGETVITATSRQNEVSASCKVRVVEDIETYFKTKLRDAFETIPESIGNLHQLGILYIDFNQLSGEIPASIGNLTGLLELYLAKNNLSGQIPESILNNPNFSNGY